MEENHSLGVPIEKRPGLAIADRATTADIGEEGAPISRAILTFGDPEKVARYEALKRGNAGKRRRVIRRRGNFIYHTNSDSLIRAEISLWEELCKDLWQQLSTRVLIASGLEWPPTADTCRRDLNFELWQFLLLHRYDCVKIRGQKLWFCNVRVRQTQPEKTEELCSAAVEATEQSPALAKRQTRRSKVRVFEAELRRRAESGEIERSWGLQSRALFGWHEKAHVGEKPAAGKTLRNQLKPLYDKLLQKHLKK